MSVEENQELAGKKLSILYIIAGFGFPLTNTQVTAFYTDNGAVSYFDLQLYIGELIGSGLITSMDISGRTLYTLSDNGEEALRLFTDQIPPELRNAADAFILLNKEGFSKENRKQLTAQTYNNDDRSAVVDMLLKEGSDVLLEIKLNVGVGETFLARQFESAWLKKGARIYKNMIDTLIEDSDK